MSNILGKSVTGRADRDPLVFPTDQDIENIAKELKLDKAQKLALRTAVERISIFAEQILGLEAKNLPDEAKNLPDEAKSLPKKAKNLPYADRLKRVKGVEKALRRLRDEVERNRDVMGEIIPEGVGESLVKSLTFTAVSRAIGADRFPGDRHLGRLIDRLTRERRLTVKALEENLHRRYRVPGIEHGHVLFDAIVNDLHEPFRNWVELQRHNEGGLHPEWCRELVLDQLIRSSDAIIGKRATSTFGGKFVDLCDAVLGAFGRPTEGSAKAVAAALKRRKGNNA